MCGIAGYIGVSKNPKLSFELITSLFYSIESRGYDASGVWATEHGGKGRVIYHKEPIRSSEFIKKFFWKKIRKINTDMLLVHARATSSKGGSAKFNANNHPFVSLDKRIGMVHNGNIDEADFLKTTYQTISETDSECLLRIYEHGLDDMDNHVKNVPISISSRLSGIKDIWSFISHGAMAVALGERIDDHNRGLFLFRNEKRPLWLADLRKTLGQIFFFSTPEIWHQAVKSSYTLEKICWKSTKLIELPSNQAWYLGLDEQNNSVSHANTYRFKLETKLTGIQYTTGEYKPIKPAQVSLDVITRLDDKDEVKKSKKDLNTYHSYEEETEDLWKEEQNNYDEDFTNWQDSMNCDKNYEDVCFDISKVLKDIETSLHNSICEGSLEANTYISVLEYLNQTKKDLEGTLRLIEHSS